MGSWKTRILGETKIVHSALGNKDSYPEAGWGLFVCYFDQEFDSILHMSRGVEFEELICLDKGVPRQDSPVSCYRDQHC